MNTAAISDLGRLARALDYSASAADARLLGARERHSMDNTLPDVIDAIDANIERLEAGLGSQARDAVTALRQVRPHLETAAALAPTEAVPTTPRTGFLARFRKDVPETWDYAATAPHYARASEALAAARATIEETPGIVDLADLARTNAARARAGAAAIERPAPGLPEGVDPAFVDSWASRHGDALQDAVRGVIRLARPVTHVASEGVEHVPATGAALIAPSHNSVLDSFYLADGMRRNVRFMANHTVTGQGWTAPFFSNGGAFPVNNTGGRSAEGLAIARQILSKERRPVTIFPEGRIIAGEYIGEPKRGLARLALETGAPVVPVGAYGTKTASVYDAPVTRKAIVYDEAIPTSGMPNTPEYVDSLSELVAQRIDAANRRAEEIARSAI